MITFIIIIIVTIRRCLRYTYQWSSSTTTSRMGSTCLTLWQVPWWDTVGMFQPGNVHLIRAKSHSRTRWKKFPTNFQ